MMIKFCANIPQTVEKEFSCFDLAQYERKIFNVFDAFSVRFELAER